MAEFCTNSNASLNSTPYSLKDDIEQSSVSKKRKRMRFNSNKEVDLKNINLSSELMCPVCTKLCTNPRECHTCGHLFCAECIVQVKCCPLCRIEPFVSHESYFAHRLLDQARVKCVQCEALVVRAQLEDHMRTCATPVRSQAAQFPQGHDPDSLVIIKQESVELTQKEHMDAMMDNIEQQGSLVPSGASGLLPVASANLQLRLFTRIQFKTLQCPDNWSSRVCAMCAVSDDVVLLSLNKKGLLALSLHSGQLLPRTPCKLKRVSRMALDVRTDTLLLVLKTPCLDGHCWGLASMRHDANVHEWKEVDRLPTEFKFALFPPVIAVCESRVLFVAGSCKYLRAFDVNREHKLLPVGNVDAKFNFKYFTSTRIGADNLVAFSHQNSMSLHRLVGLKLEPYATISSTQLLWFLFRGPFLLGTRMNKDKKSSIISFLVTDNRLTLQSMVLLDFDAGVNVSHLCIVGDRLILRDGPSNDLLIYDFDVPAPLPISPLSVDYTQKDHMDAMTKENSDYKPNIIAPDNASPLAAAAGISHLHFSARIQPENFQDFDKRDFLASAFCALSSDEILVSHNEKGLRTLSLQSGQLSPRSVCALLHVSRMAFDASTDTLLLVLKISRPYDKCWWLVSLRRDANNYWKEVERLSTEVAVSTNINEIELCESHVFFRDGRVSPRVLCYSTAQPAPYWQHRCEH